VRGESRRARILRWSMVMKGTQFSQGRPFLDGIVPKVSDLLEALRRGAKRKSEVYWPHSVKSGQASCRGKQGNRKGKGSVQSGWAPRSSLKGWAVGTSRLETDRGRRLVCFERGYPLKARGGKV